MQNPYLNKTDEEVAVMVQNGQKELFGLLIDRYNQKLFRYGRRFLFDIDNVTDAVQDVFIKTYQNIHSFNPSLKFSSWIYRIAHNTFINVLKKNSKSFLSVIDSDTFLSYTVVEDPLAKEQEIKEMRELIESGLTHLSVKYREILVLYYLQELSYKEISDIIQVPVGTVGIRLKRAKETLKDIYKKINPQYESQ